MPLTTASFMLRSSLALSFPPQKRMDITYLHWLQSLLHRFLHTNYVDGPHLVSSQQDYGIELLGPVTVDPRQHVNANRPRSSKSAMPSERALEENTSGAVQACYLFDLQAYALPEKIWSPLYAGNCTDVYTESESSDLTSKTDRLLMCHVLHMQNV